MEFDYAGKHFSYHGRKLVMSYLIGVKLRFAHGAGAINEAAYRSDATEKLTRGMTPEFPATLLKGLFSNRGGMTNSAQCSHDIVVLCYREGWFCLECQQIVDHDCSYKNIEYRYGITGFRAGSKTGHKVALKYAGEHDQ